MLSIVKTDMVSNDRRASSAPRRRPARDVIAAVLQNMRENLEPLKYSTLAPSRYVVYLHPAEFARLEGILPILRDEATRALADELTSLNRRSAVRRYSARLFGEIPAVQTATGDWHVEFLPDADGDLAEGDILVDSELLLPAELEMGGERTRRITTVARGQGGQESGSRIAAGDDQVTRQNIIEHADSRAPRPLARIVYEDSSGRRSYDMTTESITIGRGGNGHPVDLRIVSSVDVSREHVRIRRDAATGRFFLLDLSTLGTTLNDRHVPRGIDEVDSGRRETGVETPLPNRARIGLAETVFLEFTVVAE